MVHWSCPSFSSTIFQNFPGISDVSNFQHHGKLCSSCSTSPVSSFNLSSLFFWKRFFFSLNAAFAMAVLDLISLIGIHLASFVIMLPKYIVEIFHLLRLFLIYHHLYWGWLSWNSYYHSFFFSSFFSHSFTYHSTFQFQLVYQSCPIVPCQKFRYFSITSPKVSAYPSMCMLYQIEWRVGEERTNRWHKYRCLFTLG